VLIFLSILVMLAVGYAYAQEGALTAFMMFCNVFIAGLVACNFFEPLATGLEEMLAQSFLEGYEDCLSLVGLFAVTLALLRWLTNQLANIQTEQQALVQQGGGVLFGIMTGYLAAGFLAVVLQTIPWGRNFLGFDPRVDPESVRHGLRRVLPPDRVFLGLMHRAGRVPLSRNNHPTFDADGSLENNYTRLRRSAESAAPP
jgi:hypothetical protein